MSPTTPQLRDQWALKGAVARLREINEEVNAIFEAFPELKGAGQRSGLNLDGVGQVGKKRRVMSPEARKRMSEGMRKFWMRRKAAAKSPKSKRD
jgi:hypothetical protein